LCIISLLYIYFLAIIALISTKSNIYR